VDATARVDTDAKVIRSFVGSGAVVAGHAEVIDSVVMSGARIAAGARVESSIVGARALIGERCELTDLSVVGYDEDVEAGTTLRAGSLPDPDSW